MQSRRPKPLKPALCRRPGPHNQQTNARKLTPAEEREAKALHKAAV